MEKRFAAEQGKPNFLLVIADDLGWSDLGAFGGEIDTPSLDRLALGGVRFTGFHTAPTCSPTRAMLMSGVDNHAAGLGAMAEELTPATRGRPGYEGYLNDRVASIAELLREGGYRTLMAGKWHLGLTPDRSPAARGFERSFSMLEGLGNHFGEDQNARWAKVERATYMQGMNKVPFPKGAYSTDLFTDKLLGFLGEEAGDKPFFAYLAFSAPHWPLQAPATSIAKYKGLYDAGPESLRAERLARQKRLGLLPAEAVAHPMIGITPWSDLTPTQRALEARKMEVYAAMIDRIDHNVGRVLAGLQASGQFHNTLILFASDNGPEGGRIEAPEGIVDPKVSKTLAIDNSLDNIGAGTSYVGYGPGWAQACSAPSWLMKGFTTEGGIRTPAFASGPHVAGGRISHAFLHVTDIAPTLLDAAGLTQPATFKGRPIVPYQGHSLVPLLAGRVDAVRSESEVVSWELFGERAVRHGTWKAVYIAPGRSRDLPPEDLQMQGSGRWQLFDLAVDPGETTDLAGREPARVATLVASWNRYAQAQGVILPASGSVTSRLAQKP